MARDVQFAVGQYVEFKEDKEDSKLFRWESVIDKWIAFIVK